MVTYFVKGKGKFFIETSYIPSCSGKELVEKLTDPGSKQSVFIEERTVRDRLERIGRLGDMDKLKNPGDHIIYLEI